ncbi:MAG: SDR family oxidoreductase [Phycisphaerae bacterium]|nr:SDR family oxidoreductase [Phycisphaerae bacterium]
MTQTDRPVALVTGASAGIGLAFAELLADRGHDVVLVARRRDRLAEAAKAIEARGARAHVICADLADPASSGRVAREALARCSRVDVLVNNAGYGLATKFVETPWEQHRAFLEVLLVSVTELTHRLLPSMLARRSGRVIQIASVAAYAPESAGSLYSPTKRFMVSFTRALALELKGSGVTTTAVCPGFTYSEFHDVMGNRAAMNRLPAWMWKDAASVARIGLDAADRGRTIVVPGAVNQAIAALCAVVPFSLVQRFGPKKLLDRHER